MVDCQDALRLNSQFGKAHKRMFKIYYSMGDLANAKISLDKAIALESHD